MKDYRQLVGMIAKGDSIRWESDEAAGDGLAASKSKHIGGRVAGRWIIALLDQDGYSPLGLQAIVHVSRGGQTVWEQDPPVYRQLELTGIAA